MTLEQRELWSNNLPKLWEEIELFLEILITKMFYNSSSGLQKFYSVFLDDSWEFSTSKFEDIVNKIIEKIRSWQIVLPNVFRDSIKVERIINNGIDDFSDETNLSQQIHDFLYSSWYFNWFIDSEKLNTIKSWFNDYLWVKKRELFQEQVSTTILKIVLWLRWI